MQTRWGKAFPVGRRLVTAAVVVALLSACTGKAGDTGGERGTENTQAPSTPAAGSTIARDGIFNVSRTNEATFRVAIDDVLRAADRTVLRLTVTNLESTEQLGIDRFGASSSDQSFLGFRLLDPVGGKLYYGLRQDTKDGPGFGSRLHQIKLQPGVHYSAVAYFPSLPQSVSAVTVLSPGTTGEFTGVPVTAGEHRATPLAKDAAEESRQIVAINSPHRPGTSVELPSAEPPSDAWSLVADVSGLVVTPERETTASPERRSVALRSDILFPFGSAALTAKAKTLVAEAAKEIAASADPSRPVSVTGHTDGVGDPPDNQKLSEQRARAVAAQLRSTLAGSWRLSAAGKGETEPVVEETNVDGSDDAEGRARNRRVEVTYPLKAATEAAGGGDGTDQASGAAGTPAPFRPDDGTVVAEREAVSDSRSDSAGPVTFQLRVHPFHRDGRYLVAVFDLTNKSGQKLDTSWGYFRSAAYPGPTYASFSVMDPGTKAAYRPAFVTIENVNEYLDGKLYGLESAEPQRAYMYVPAPSASVSSVTFDAGPFGKVENVPVS